MKKQPIHQNLNTSFVNVRELVRYLRGLQFVGSIRIELASYEAEIIFTESKTIRAREYDHIAGRISHGESALQRILVRAREPHGLINVFKATEGYAGRSDGSIFVDKVIMTGARELAASRGGASMRFGSGRELVLSGRDSEHAVVLAALSELLRAIDEELAAGNLSFSEAFNGACDAIAAEFPFLQKTSRALLYRNGEIKLNTDADAKQVSSAVFAALRPIFQRLRGEAKYTQLVKATSNRLLKMSTDRRLEFVNMGLIGYVEDLIADDK